jgi:hypothetical protein
LLIGQHLQMPGIDGEIAIVPYHRGAVIPDGCLGKDRNLAQGSQRRASGSYPTGKIDAVTGAFAPPSQPQRGRLRHRDGFDPR